MRLKLLRAAAMVAVLGGTATFGLGTQAALAQPTFEPCGTDLTTVITSTTSGEFSLAAGCTYVVTSQLTVMHTVIIDGHHASIVRSYSADPFSVFVVGCSTGNLTLNQVNVRNGGGDEINGGAIDISNSNAQATVNGGTFKDNNAIEYDTYGGYGGAIFNLGTLTVSGATFIDNGAEWGGAISSGNPDKTATLDHSSFVGNDAYEGGAIYNTDNNMQLDEGNFRYNSAEYGGAIYNNYNLTADDSLFAMNSASSEGGAIYNEDNLTLNHSLLVVNRAHDGGGGIYNDDETVNLTFDQINQNFPDNCEPTNTITGCVG